MKLTKSLAGKIFSGYIAIGMVCILTFGLCVYILSKNKNTDQEISERAIPTLILYKDLNMQISGIGKLSQSWIYTPTPADKDRLNKMIEKEYPLLKQRLITISEVTVDKANLDSIENLKNNIEEFVDQSKQISKTLASDSDYASDAKVDAAITIYNKQFLPKKEKIEKMIDNSIQSYNSNLALMKEEKNRSYTILWGTMTIMVIIIIVTGLISLIYVKRNIIRPINDLKQAINIISTGEIIELNELKSTDEVGEMHGSIRKMIDGLKASTSFAVEIGKGKYDASYQPLGSKDEMGNALIEMRQNLQKVSEEDKKRNWSNTGLAQIGEILRSNQEKTETLYNNIISFLVKYLNANQGGLFSIVNENENDIHLQLVSCYAFEKRKYLTKRIEIGEGLVGQSVQEKDIIFMTDVPDEYIHITSGLGHANPRSILIVPLKINEEIHGAIELASFSVFEDYQVEFVKKLSESIASTLSSVKTNIQTKKLLEVSQQQSEEMRAQEEEMRQNMEELSATQEELQRKEKGYIDRIQELESQLESSKN